MIEKYRFCYEDNDKCCKDDMIWIFENVIIGISDNSKQFVINHYNKDFDLSKYKKVDLEYSLDDYYKNYMEWCFSEPVGWYL